MDLKQEIEQKRDRIGCMAVGCSNHTKLHFHHVQKELKRRSPLGCITVRGAIDELRKCIILCESCHRKAHSREVLYVHKHIEFCQSFLSTKYYSNVGSYKGHDRYCTWRRHRKRRLIERKDAFRAGIKTKWCRCCDLHLDRSCEFYKNSSSRDGLSGTCKKCCRHKRALRLEKLKAMFSDNQPK